MEDHPPYRRAIGVEVGRLVPKRIRRRLGSFDPVVGCSVALWAHGGGWRTIRPTSQPSPRSRDPPFLVPFQLMNPPRWLRIAEPSPSSHTLMKHTLLTIAALLGCSLAAQADDVRLQPLKDL